MLSEDGEKPFAVRRFNEVNHFVDDHVFNQIFRLRNQARVYPDMTCFVIAASPFCLHPLQEIAVHFYADFRFPL